MCNFLFFSQSVYFVHRCVVDAPNDCLNNDSVGKFSVVKYGTCWLFHFWTERGLTAFSMVAVIEQQIMLDYE